MKQHHDVFTAKMFRRLFVPSLFAAFGLAFADMADAVVMGLSMGETGLATIGMSLPLFMLINLFMHGFGIGGSVRCAQLLGGGHQEEALRSFNRVLQGALAVSLGIALTVNLFPAFFLRILGTTAADGALYVQTQTYVRLIAAGAPLFFLNYILNYYLRCDDQAGRASAGFLAGTLADILLNVLLVLVFSLGTLGAALATLAGAAVSVLCYLPALVRGGHSLRLQWAKPGFAEAFSCLKTGLSSSAQYVYQLIFLLVANHTLMGISGETGVAVLDVVQNASYLILYLYDAAAKALQPLAGTFYAEKNRSALRHSLYLALGWGLVCGSAAAAAIWVAPEAVCTLLGLDTTEALQMGVSALRIYCLSGAFAGVSIILESYAQAVELEHRAFVIASLRGGIVLLPVTLLMAALAPTAFWWVFPLTEFFSLALYLLWRGFQPAVQPELDPARILSGTIRSRTEDLAPLNENIEAFCEKWSATPKQSYFVTMAVEEISLAIIQQAFDRLPDGYIQVTLIACPEGEFELHVRDNATFFNPFSLETEKIREDGDFNMDAMGILVIKKKAKSFFYRQYQGFNTLIVRI